MGQRIDMSRKEEFLKEKSGSSSQHHKEYLGMDVPEGYFKSSKQSILDLVQEETRLEDSGKKETPVFYFRRSFQVAASIALLVALVIGFQFSDSTSTEIASDDLLIESLFVEDDSMNDFVEGILVSDVVEEAGKGKDMEDFLVNSLFVDDSLLEDYTNESLLDNIIL